MTTTTLRTWTIEGRDDDGNSETMTVAIETTEDGTIEVVKSQDGRYLDGQECDTLAFAAETAAEWAAEARRDYRDAERERVRELRSSRKAALLDVASGMAGEDREAVRELARLVGKGKGAEALAALRAAGLA